MMGMATMAEVEARDAEELSRLVRFMTRPGRRFGLALATYNDASVAEQVREQACARAGVRTVTVVAPAGAQLLERLVEASSEHDVVFVIGLDEIAYDASERGPTTRAIVELNFRRDELPERLDVRVVLWISTEAYGQLARLAWDLLDVMLLRFEFLAERVPAPEQLELPPPTRPAWMTIPDDVNMLELAKQAASFGSAAQTATDEFTKADAAASAGQLFASIGRLDDAAKWLEVAALGYERLGQRQNEARYTLAAATQLRRAAEVAQLRGEAESARRLAERSAEIAGTVVHETRGGAGEQIRALGVLASLPEGQAPPGDVDDQQLLERWRIGDREAAARLLKRYYPKVRYFMMARAPADVVDDLVQATVTETFLQAMRRWPLGVPFGRYIFRVARGVWLSWLRRSSRRGESVDFNEEELVEIDAADSLTAVLRNEEFTLLLEALRNISVHEQDLLELHYLNELTVSELAEIFGVPRSTIQSRLRSARLRLLQEAQRLAGDRFVEIMDEVTLSRELEELGAKLRRAV